MTIVIFQEKDQLYYQNSTNELLSNSIGGGGGGEDSLTISAKSVEIMSSFIWVSFIRDASVTSK